VKTGRHSIKISRQNSELIVSSAEYVIYLKFEVSERERASALLQIGDRSADVTSKPPEQMNLVTFALRRPTTILVAVLATILLGVFAVQRMPRDIFPDLGVPVLYIAQPYGGMTPAQMEGFLVNYLEYYFLYMTGIEHVESKSIQGAALIKLQFHPGIEPNDEGGHRSYGHHQHGCRHGGDRGLCKPLPRVAGTVPVGNLVFTDESGKVDLKDLQDTALFKVRPMFATLPAFPRLRPSAVVPARSSFLQILIGCARIT
jgi:hypothetical protein